MDELRIEVKPKAGEITCNFDDVKAALENQMQAYEELEVTEENTKERKADVATLRKIKKYVDERRKEVEAEYDRPLVAFKARVKELTSVIDVQIDRINDGLNAFEEARKAEKREHIKELYTVTVGKYAEYLPLDVIKSDRWENKTYSDNDIISEIQERILRVQGDLAAIRGLNSPIEDELIRVYKARGNDLTSAVEKHTAFVEAKAMAEAQVRKEAAEVEKPAPIVEPEPLTEPVVMFRIKGEIHISEVREYLEFNEIPFEEVQVL